MADVRTIFGMATVSEVGYKPLRQSIEQTENYAIKEVVITQELIVKKLWLDQASNTYFIYNSATSEVDLYVNGALRASF